ncbi:hypothetical protein V2W30_01710 [Streptomyces sp. Q6]|uniref:Uncharacterized protein n=1 Tax=Streptomyces citrinus TaxID=3118173 RepID=A0ACD5A4S9_9ACTN
MTSVDRTPTAPPEPSSDRLAWAIVATAFVSVVALVVLALTHNSEAALVVGTIGGGVTTMQINARNRR